MVKVNENWESRAFEASERRNATKQRKHEKSRKRSNKLQVQNALTLLDQFSDRLWAQSSYPTFSYRPLEIHLWIDSTPSDHLTNDLKEDKMKTQKEGRSKSNPFVTPPSTPQSSSNQRRPRSNSFVTPPSTPQRNVKNGRKSKGRLLKSSDTDEWAPLLCSSNFFSGKCSGISKKKGYDQSGCRNGKHIISLHQVLLGRPPSDTNREKSLVDLKFNASREALLASKEAAEAHFYCQSFAISGQIHTLYHLSLTVGKSSEDSGPRLSDSVTKVLSEQDCPLASMVYLVVDGVLIFDRYRDGVVISDEEQTLTGDYEVKGSKRRSILICDRSEHTIDRDESVDESILIHHQNLVQNLPGQVLEYIVLFLPDDVVAKLPLVCQTWYNEIGRSSPELWKELLYRRAWPENVYNQSLMISNNARDMYRNIFVSHYTLVRDLTSVVLGLEALESGFRSNTVSLCPNKDLAMLHYKDSQQSRCMSGETILRIFSKACVLVANRDECTLHLFDTAETSCGIYRRCRKRLSVSVAPFSTSKRKKCRLIAMDLDHQTICCLFLVGPEEDQKAWLGLIERDDVLCTGGSGTTVSQVEVGALRFFDLHSTVLQCLISCDDDEVTTWIYSHLMRGSKVDLSLVEVDIKGGIVACGNGRFLFEAAIALPLSFDENTDDMDLMASALLKLFLFDADREEIIWVGPEGGASTMQFWYQFKTSIIGNKLAVESSDNPIQYNELAFVSRVSADVTNIRVSCQGDVDCVKVGQCLVSQNLDHINGNWRRSPEYDRVVVTTPSDIIVGECYRQVGRDSTVSSHKSLLSFYPKDARKTVTNQMIIDGNCVCFPIEPFRGDHIIAFSRLEAAEDSIVAHLIHVLSRQVIHVIQTNSLCSILGEDGFSFSIDTLSHSVAVASQTGLLLAGQDIRSFTDSVAEKNTREQKSRPEKTKKKGGRQKSEKKRMVSPEERGKGLEGNF